MYGQCEIPVTKRFSRAINTSVLQIQRIPNVFFLRSQCRGREFDSPPLHSYPVRVYVNSKSTGRPAIPTKYPQRGKRADRIGLSRTWFFTWFFGGSDMPRKRLTKPWLHEASGFWCTSIDRKRVYLDKDYPTACKKLRELRADQARQQSNQSSLDWSEAPFADLADQYLDNLRARKSLNTYQTCRHRLLRALRIVGTDLNVCDVSKLHLARIEEELASKLSPTTIRDTIGAVQAVFNWAIRYDLLVENPLQGFQKPRGRMRTRILEPNEFQGLLRHSDASFRRLLIAIRLTGCRPIELRSLIWEWVDLQNDLWILPDHKTITRQRHPKPRIIPLPLPVAKLCAWLDRQPHKPTDHVFLNARGGPYTKDCLCRKMRRVCDRAGITVKAGERLVLYSNRHTFATESSGRITDMELAELLGHTDTRTTRRYVHFNIPRLRDIQRRARKSQH